MPAPVSIGRRAGDSAVNDPSMSPLLHPALSSSLSRSFGLSSPFSLSALSSSLTMMSSSPRMMGMPLSMSLSKTPSGGGFSFSNSGYNYNGGGGQSWGMNLGRSFEEQPKLEAQFFKNFSCCGLDLQDLHRLLEHFEECHVEAFQPSAVASSGAGGAGVGEAGGQDEVMDRLRRARDEMRIQNASQAGGGGQGGGGGKRGLNLMRGINEEVPDMDMMLDDDDVGSASNGAGGVGTPNGGAGAPGSDEEGTVSAPPSPRHVLASGRAHQMNPMLGGGGVGGQGGPGGAGGAGQGQGGQDGHGDFEPESPMVSTLGMELDMELDDPPPSLPPHQHHQHHQHHQSAVSQAMAAQHAATLEHHGGLHAFMPPPSSSGSVLGGVGQGLIRPQQQISAFDSLPLNEAGRKKAVGAAASSVVVGGGPTLHLSGPAGGISAQFAVAAAAAAGVGSRPGTPDGSVMAGQVPQNSFFATMNPQNLHSSVGGSSAGGGVGGAGVVGGGGGAVAPSLLFPQAAQQQGKKGKRTMMFGTGGGGSSSSSTGGGDYEDELYYEDDGESFDGPDYEDAVLGGVGGGGGPGGDINVFASSSSSANSRSPSLPRGPTASTSSLSDSTSGVGNPGLVVRLNPSVAASMSSAHPLGTGVQISPSGRPYTPPSEKPFKCTVPGCDKSYKQQNGLKYHRLHGHCNQNALGREGEENKEEGKPYICHVASCGKRYKNMNGLRYHYQHSGAHGALGLQMLAQSCHPPPQYPPGHKRSSTSQNNSAATSRANSPAPTGHLPTAAGAGAGAGGAQGQGSPGVVQGAFAKLQSLG